MSLANLRRQPLERGDRLQPAMQGRERLRVTGEAPRPAPEVVEHRRPIQAVHHDFGVADRAGGGDGVAVRAGVLHRRDLERGVARLPIATEDFSGPMGEDVCGATGSQHE